MIKLGLSNLLEDYLEIISCLSPRLIFAWDVRETKMVLSATSRKDKSVYNKTDKLSNENTRIRAMRRKTRRLVNQISYEGPLRNSD
jgi:hypothetical protein